MQRAGIADQVDQLRSALSEAERHWAEDIDRVDTRYHRSVVNGIRRQEDRPAQAAATFLVAV